MLDSKTLEWLERREYRLEKTGYYMSLWDFPKMTLWALLEKHDYRDAAEFEARVARCVTIGSKLTISDIPFECVKKQSIQELALMAARLQVEQEMDRP